MPGTKLDVANARLEAALFRKAEFLRALVEDEFGGVGGLRQALRSVNEDSNAIDEILQNYEQLQKDHDEASEAALQAIQDEAEEKRATLPRVNQFTPTDEQIVEHGLEYGRDYFGIVNVDGHEEDCYETSEEAQAVIDGAAKPVEIKDRNFTVVGKEPSGSLIFRPEGTTGDFDYISSETAEEFGLDQLTDEEKRAIGLIRPLELNHLSGGNQIPAAIEGGVDDLDR